ADLPDHGAAALKDREVWRTEIRDVPHRCRPPVASEGGEIGRFALGSEGVAADHEEDVAERSRLEMVQASSVRIRRRVRESSAGRDLEHVCGIRGEVRE